MSFKFFSLLQVLNQNIQDMSKGQDAKKEDKKKPLKTLKEKRAEKKAKKAGK